MSGWDDDDYGLSSDFNFDTGYNVEDSINDTDDGFGEFNDASNGVKETKRTAWVAIGCGIGLIVIVVILINLFSGLLNKDDVNNEVSNNNVGSNPVHVQNNEANNNVVNNSNVNQNQVKPETNIVINQTETGWVEFDDDSQLTFEQEYVETTFTVESVKHYTKLTGDNYLEVKTIAVGSLAGFVGDYEVEIPYSIGKYLAPTNCINAKVQKGATQNGEIVVGEIVLE